MDQSAQQSNQQELTSALPPPVALRNMASGYWVSQAVYVAAKLGIAPGTQDQRAVANRKSKRRFPIRCIPQSHAVNAIVMSTHRRTATHARRARHLERSTTGIYHHLARYRTRPPDAGRAAAGGTAGGISTDRRHQPLCGRLAARRAARRHGSAVRRAG